ncbi:hypothetical protein ABTX77_40755 [Streptomyces sp. NPDC097704]|uniref:hypothetical protein n=1 Tax=Streptomyces sp. NPDC097704 TaxID=3157101 RepID=UPI00332E5E2B
MLRLGVLAVTAVLSFGGTPAQAVDGPEKLTVMSNEQYEELLSSQGRPAAPCGAAPRTDTDTMAIAAAAPGRAAPNFNSKDRRSKVTPTRVGTSESGWKHFSGPHGIMDPNVVKKITGVFTAYCRNVSHHRCPGKVDQARPGTCHRSGTTRD